MAYISCIENLGKSIAPNCTNPILGGYTGRALLFASLDFDPTIALGDKRIITNIESIGDGYIAVDNVQFVDPFTGSDKSLNTDAGFRQFKKMFSCKVPLRGTVASKGIFEAIANSIHGFVAVVEKKDKVGNGSYEVIGYEHPLYITADGYTKSEYAEGGAAVVTMETSESVEEYAFYDNIAIASTKVIFDGLFNSSPN